MSAPRLALPGPAPRRQLVVLVVVLAAGRVMSALGGFTAEAFRVAWLVRYRSACSPASVS
jgi:hypothetical protein